VRLTGLMAGQAAAQILGAAAGLILAWKLPKQDYAWITLVNSMIAAVLRLSDPATGTGLQNLGGKIWKDRTALSSLVATALRMRWKLLAISLALAGSWTIALLMLNGATWPQAAVLCTIGAAGLPAALGYTIHSTACKLHGRLRLLVAADVWTASFRLACTSVFILIRPVAILAALSVTFSYLTQYWLGRRQTASLITLPAAESPEHRTQLTRQMRQMFLYGLFQCAQAQLGVWLLGLYGNAEAVAELGALLRLGVLLAIVGPVFQYWIVPNLARIQDRHLLGRQLIQTAAGTLAVLVAISLLASLASEPLVYFLGPNYRHLGPEIPWVMLFLSISILVTVAWWINTARGWTHLSWLVPPVTSLLMVGLVVVMQPANVRAALIFMSASLLPGLIIATVQMAAALRKS
jgi:O-antigen/teichoic acid export membrane protein